MSIDKLDVVCGTVITVSVAGLACMIVSAVILDNKCDSTCGGSTGVVMCKSDRVICEKPGSSNELIWRPIK